MATSVPIIDIKGVSKYFGSLAANSNVSFQIHAGTIHAIVGENGAGKSTIMKILFGMYTPDQGQIFVRGKAQDISTPAIAKKLKIGMVHQHFMLAGPLSALDHVVLEGTHPPTGLVSSLPRKKVLNELLHLSNQLQMSVPWLEPIETLPVGIQQRIEILKLLYNESEILILDEPTAVLTPQEIQDFLDQLRRLRDQGKTILLITHKLKEVFAVADHITILRQGSVVGSGPITQWTATSLSEAMIGERVQDLHLTRQSSKFSKKIVLKMKARSDSALIVEKGEIIGIAGVEGNGQSEIIQSLLNPQSEKTGFAKSIEINGVNTLNFSNRQIRDLGVGYLPEDRHTKGVALEASLLENFLLGQHWRFTKQGRLQKRELQMAFEKSLTAFDVKFQRSDQCLKELSGGNQQKLVVARELSKNLELLIAAHPTRGVDIQAIQKIHQAILDSRERGAGVLLISSELDEIMKLSDRIWVIYRGQWIHEFHRLPGQDFDEKKIGAAMAGLDL